MWITGKGNILIIIGVYFVLFSRWKALELYLLLWFCMWGRKVVSLMNWTSFFGPHYGQAPSPTCLLCPAWGVVTSVQTTLPTVPTFHLVQWDTDLFTVSLPYWPLVHMACRLSLKWAPPSAVIPLHSHWRQTSNWFYWLNHTTSIVCMYVYVLKDIHG